ncbi:hypothetical protein DPM19_27905 [Actinomadura craniellae]|uniref:Uncharacterized protein n=1 Tax=Actinomadura craniellae TaxID=2231787 RepID=A0A365GY96_9ACTN|nr:hypothetical protein [Actinomadura craniellae]RAY11810.1 hypothetical protein DPM19_27905 [Actinomadura craniellae]
MKTAHELMITLARRHAFGDLAALVAAGAVPAGRAVPIGALCAFGQRVLELDAEDFGLPEAAGEVPADLLDRARSSRMPQSAAERPRGALATLRPAYALLLEVIEIHWRRREMAALAAAVHIAGEYLPALAWEPVLGHAADPEPLRTAVVGPGSYFGVPQPRTPDPVTGGRPERRCEHTQALQSAAGRALKVAGEPPSGWRAYLDRQHSQVARALGVCAVRCRTPCSVVTRLDAGTREALTDRCRLALEFTDGALVKLRHAAPVGHGFGVPSPDEVLDAWRRSRTSLARRPLGAAVLADDGYPLPGLPALFSAVAGAPVRPDTLLHDVADRIAAALD